MDSTKTLVGSIQKFSTEDGPGVRTTIFLKGCPLDCVWCHNPEMISPQQQIILSPSKCIGCKECEKVCPNNCICFQEKEPVVRWNKCNNCCSCAEVCYAKAITPVAKWMSVSEVMKVIMQDKTFYDNTGGGITISGGEMLMHESFCQGLISACSKENIDVCLDTSGYSDFDVIYRLATNKNVTTILYDMKQILDEKHKEYTGVSNRLILDNLSKLAENVHTCEKLWLRMPLIAGLNDDSITIEKTGDFYKKYGIKKVSLIPYHEMGNAKARHIGKMVHEFIAPSETRINKIREYYENIGIKVDIVGRVD